MNEGKKIVNILSIVIYIVIDNININDIRFFRYIIHIPIPNTVLLTYYESSGNC
jgi:hypothetical protein